MPKETNKTTYMSNKNRILREHKTNFKTKNYNLQSNNVSNSVKYWSFTLLIMHYSVYFCWSLCNSVSFALPDFLFVFPDFLFAILAHNLGGRAFLAECPHWLIVFWLTQLNGLSALEVIGRKLACLTTMALHREEENDSDNSNNPQLEKLMKCK